MVLTFYKSIGCISLGGSRNNRDIHSIIQITIHDLSFHQQPFRKIWSGLRGCECTSECWYLNGHNHERVSCLISCLWADKFKTEVEIWPGKTWRLYVFNSVSFIYHSFPWFILTKFGGLGRASYRNRIWCIQIKNCPSLYSHRMTELK